jgi:hypothetical protein
MKKTLKSAGALGLASATILTGLSFGPAAASAAPTIPTATSDRVPFRVVFEMTNGKFAGIGNKGAAGDIITGQVDTLAEASAKAQTYEYDESNRHVYLPNGQCWYFDPAITGISATGCNLTDNRQLWTPLADGGFSVDASPERRINGTVVDGSYLRNERTHMGTSEFATIIEGIRLFDATVTSLDIGARSAVLSGRATPGAKVVINGDKEEPVDENGAWSATVTGLALGVNTITLEQYEGPGNKTDETSVDVDLAVQPVTATSTLDADVTKKATLSGTAHPGATVVIRDAAGTEIDRAPASLFDGTWSMELRAPNLGGDYPVTIHQVIDGEANGEISETIAYGAAVEVTRPVPDAAHDGGPLTMRGTGEPGAQITVREQGHTTVIGSEHVLVNGTWNLVTANLDDRKHVLEVTQTGKGNNVTTSTTTLNPEAVDTPVTVTNPANPADGYTPNTSFTFEGTGTTGKTITVENKWGTRLATTPVTDGTWSWTRTVMGTTIWQLRFVQDKGQPAESVAEVMNFTPNAAPAPLVVVTNPADVTDGYTPNTSFTFRGTATAGKTVTVENKWGTHLGDATMNGENWSWTRANMGTTTWQLHFVQDKGLATEFTAKVLGFKPNAAPAPLVVVTNPADVTDGYTPNTSFTFEGTATAGKTITVENKFGTHIATVPVDGDGTWSWTRANMGTSIWHLLFVQDKGQPAEATATVMNFKPIA